MRNALCHLSISAVSLQQGASFVITLGKLLICHQWMMSWAGRSKRLHRRGMNEEGDRGEGGGGTRVADSLALHRHSNLWSVNYPCLAQLSDRGPSSPWPLSSAPVTPRPSLLLLPHTTPSYPCSC